MLTHQPNNPNAASAPPVARPLSDFSLAAQFERDVHVEKSEKPVVASDEHYCHNCHTTKSDSEFYHRLTASTHHAEGSYMQPCRSCRKEYARLDRLKKKEKKQNDGH